MQLGVSHAVSIRTNKQARFLYHFAFITALLFRRLRAQIVNLFSYFRRLRIVSRFCSATVLTETKLLASCSPIAVILLFVSCGDLNGTYGSLSLVVSLSNIGAILSSSRTRRRATEQCVQITTELFAGDQVDVD